jgi:pimeloyl-ACP methyl ester carboxylesterase
MSDYIFSARNINNNSFGDDVDANAHYLIVPDDANAISASHIVLQKDWLLNLIIPDAPPDPLDDILIYVHGYNNNENDVLTNHRIIKSGLEKLGYKGKTVSFDWPCGSSALMYLPDRHKAKITAMQLVNSGIALLARQQDKNCTINVHILAHSTGAYVVREAFDDADDTNEVSIGVNTGVSVNSSNWMVTQMIFISGDVAASSMSEGAYANSIYKHSVRVTNYSNPYDKVLALSNVKRAGFENRVGRIGLPLDAPVKAVNVNNGPYFNTIKDDVAGISFTHSWYFNPDYNQIFMQDLLYTIQGDIDRNYIPTRTLVNGELDLKITLS